MTRKVQEHHSLSQMRDQSGKFERDRSKPTIKKITMYLSEEEQQVILARRYILSVSNRYEIYRYIRDQLADVEVSDEEAEEIIANDLREFMRKKNITVTEYDGFALKEYFLTFFNLTELIPFTSDRILRELNTIYTSDESFFTRCTRLDFEKRIRDFGERHFIYYSASERTKIWEEICQRRVVEMKRNVPVYDSE